MGRRGAERLDGRIAAVVRDRRVRDAMRRTPRDRFVPEAARAFAFEDTALPIGRGQTISQPSLVGVMAEALRLRGDERVLEIGTGSGYNAAILSRLAAEVVTVEAVDELRERAEAVLRELGRANVVVLPAGDALGAPERAPFDAIIVTAAAPRVPDALVAQLRVGGRLVLPVGSRTSQRLTVVTRTADGAVEEHGMACRFVPLLGPDGFAPLPDRERRPG